MPGALLCCEPHQWRPLKAYNVHALKQPASPSLCSTASLCLLACLHAWPLATPWRAQQRPTATLGAAPHHAARVARPLTLSHLHRQTDERTVLVVEDVSSPNVLRFRYGDEVKRKVGNGFFIELQSRWGRGGGSGRSRRPEPEGRTGFS